MPLPSGSERHTAPPASADSTRDVVQEDFLFHLYRGSELLQENRVLEAKEELEYALTMQPRDAKGQDLLGAVYFRLGLYPRAIQIYEALEREFSRDTSVKINLALAYLKTGQAEPARRVLQDAVRLQPEHKRAWGYLGLALQKLGELEQAQVAFERGGHPLMVKRVTERRRQSMPPPLLAPQPHPSAEAEEGVREMAETAFSELDAGELRFSLAAPEPPRPGDGPWHAVELGDAAKIRSPYTKTVPPPSALDPRGVHESVTVPPPSVAVLTRQIPPPPEPTPLAAPPSPAVAPPTALRGPSAPPALGLPNDRSIALVDAGLLVVRTSDEPPRPFASRLDALRVVAGSVTTRVMHRRAREADTSEVLGGVGSPIVRVAGPAQLVVGPRPGHQIALLSLCDELAFIREERVLGFDLCVAYENGRVALEYPGERARPAADGVPIVQLRGTGALALELTGPLAMVASVPGRPLLVRREWVVGWLGRLVMQAVPPAEAPGGQRGLLSFSGEGAVLVCVS